MAVGPDKVRILVTLDKETAEKLDELAERFRHSRSKAAAISIEAGLDSLNWLDRYLLSPESAWKFASLADRLAKKVGLPQPFDTNGISLDERKVLNAKGRRKRSASPPSSGKRKK